MKSNRQEQSNSSSPISKPIRMFFDGAGCRVNGEGSGFAWFCPDTGQKHVERVKGLTNNQAEYKGFIEALKHVPEDSVVDFFSDSQLICAQYSGDFRVKDYALQQLLSEVLALILSKRLKMTLHWVPRNQNLAGKFL
jgi:ribonuclease HI